MCANLGALGRPCSVVDRQGQEVAFHKDHLSAKKPEIV